MKPAREVNIALWARLYRLLADSGEYMRVARLDDIAERVADTRYNQAPCLNAVDADLVVHATPVDRLCGKAVRVLTKGACAGLVESLAELERDRRAAIALALPPKRRKAVFGPRVEVLFDLDEELLRVTEEMVAAIAHAAKVPWSVPSKSSYELADFNEALRRRDTGLPVEFTDAQRKAIAAPPPTEQELVERAQ